MMFSRLTGRLRGFWIGQPLVLLLVAVVVPSACVLWFMNEAVRNQAEATQRSVADAYRGQLRLLRGRVQAHWESRAADVESRLTLNSQQDFQKLVAAGVADSMVLVGQDGRPLYPSLIIGLGGEAPIRSGDWMLEHAAQQLVRDQMQAGDRAGAIETIQRDFVNRQSSALDTQGRSMVADAQLLLFNLLPPTNPRRASVLARLTTLVNDYAGTKLPAAQRVFVMAELQAHGAKRETFPTFEAERLALTYLEADRPMAGRGGVLRPTSVRDVWQLTSPNGRAVGLYRTQTVKLANDAVLRDQTSPVVEFVSLAPGEATDDEAIAIGAALPGWVMTFIVRDPAAFAPQALVRRSSYLAIALLAIGAIALIVALIGGTARRQARLAALKTDLVSTVSHELKTPLASMRLLVDSLLEDAELDPTKTRDYLKLMSAENGRLTRLIDNFLTFSRLERKRHRFTFTRTSVDDVISGALEALPEERRGARAPLVDVEAALPMMVADRDALVTVLLNLLDNAYKYSPADAAVALRVFRERNDVVFAVADNGIGIPAREQRRIFGWFYRVDQRLARQAPGTGLGLSIVDAIARAHGGRVRVRSQPAHGSTFEVCVPCATAEA
jgi:signal transduction histidine kinase